MGIFSRLSDIMNSNISAMLDKAENPEKLIRLVIQEMEETLVEVRSSTARLLADRKTLERRSQSLTDEAADWQRKAELALSHEREDLAKAALLEKADVSDTIALLNRDRDKLDDALAKLGVEIEQLQSKLNEARARQKTLLMRHQATASRQDISGRLHDTSIDRALSRFDHVERRIERMEGDIEARELSAADIKGQFAELEKQGRIDEELTALKQKLSKA